MAASQIRDRINDYLTKNSISRTQFAKKTGLKQSTIQRQLSGDTALSAETIDALALNYPVNVSWLLLGQGPMNIPDETPNDEPAGTLSISDALAVIRSQQQIIERQAEMLENLVRKNNPNNI